MTTTQEHTYRQIAHGNELYQFDLNAVIGWKWIDQDTSDLNGELTVYLTSGHSFYFSGDAAAELESQLFRRHYPTERQKATYTP